jgi:membrane protease YdiL (CAAX protease family)
VTIPASEDNQVVSVEPVQEAMWSVRDTWLGVLLLVLVIAGIVIISIFLPEHGLARELAAASLEALVVLPAVVVLGIRRIQWKSLGFRKFTPESLALGVGLLFVMYPLLIVHNLVLQLLGIDTQGDSITELFRALENPLPFIFSAVILAPLTEEIFFRGFLYSGLRQRYGWVKSMLLSSAVFAVFHLQLVALIPTFLLGCVLAFTYERARSIWPGVILHLMVNGLAMCVTILLIELDKLPGF